MPKDINEKNRLMTSPYVRYLKTISAMLYRNAGGPLKNAIPRKINATRLLIASAIIINAPIPVLNLSKLILFINTQIKIIIQQNFYNNR